MTQIHSVPLERIKRTLKIQQKSRVNITTEGKSNKGKSRNFSVRTEDQAHAEANASSTEWEREREKVSLDAAKSR